MARSAGFRSLLLLCVAGSLICGSSAQACKSQTFTNKKTFQNCVDLLVLNSSLHWTYSPSKGTLDIAYWATPAPADGWVAWAINPTDKGMIGSQAIVGYVVSGKLKVITTKLDSYGPSMKNESLSFHVSNLAGESKGTDIILFATLTPPTKNSSVNQVWQTGPLSDGAPAMHLITGDHLRSKGTLHLSGSSASTPGGAPSTNTTGAAPAGAPGQAPTGAAEEAPTGASGATPGLAPSMPTSGGDSKIRSKSVTFLANSFVVDSIVLLSVLVFHLI